MEKEEFLKIATSTIDGAANKPEREDDLYNPQPTKHPKGAVKVGYDSTAYNRVINACSINLQGLTFTLLPVLYALGMASKEYLVKYRGLSGDDLKRAIKKDYIALGGYGINFDLMVDNKKYRNCFTFPTSPDRKYWAYIDLDYVGDNLVDRYPCPLCFRFRAMEMAPEFEIWISGKQLEKRKEQEHVIDVLNKFFENGATLGLLLEYFGHFEDNRIIPNNLGTSNEPFKNVMK